MGRISHSFLRVAMGCQLTILGASFVSISQAEETPGTAHQLVIQPSSTKVPLAKADLTLSTLQCKDGVFCGEYKIVVTPFSFKNDYGSLKLNVSEKTAEKMTKGEAAKFTGLATSARDGKTKAIKGDTLPKANDNGSVSFVVSTEDGDLLFNSTYRFVDK